MVVGDTQLLDSEIRVGIPKRKRKNDDSTRCSKKKRRRAGADLPKVHTVLFRGKIPPSWPLRRTITMLPNTVGPCWMVVIAGVELTISESGTIL